MNFTEVVQQVMDLTARTDKKAEIENAVNTTLSLCIYKASFVDDLVEITKNAEPSIGVYSGTVNLSGLTNYRKMKYIRPTNLTDFFIPKQPQGVLLLGQVVRNIYWISGTSLNWTSSVPVDTLELGYYVYPPQLTDAAPTHWFLDKAPWVIIDLACARIFKSLGFLEEGASHEAQGAALYITIKNDLEDQVMPEAR